MKITDRGYWVSTTFKWISVLYWTAYSIYFRTLTYFSVANPKIYLGGMLDERKSDIYDLVSDKYLPKMNLYADGIEPHIDEICQQFAFPIILKPDVGFRGYKVKRIDDRAELESVAVEYAGKEMLIQEFLSEPHEYAVFYYYVDEGDYGVCSLVEKHLPKVQGDGLSTLMQLIEQSNNPYLNMSWVLKKNKEQLDQVIPDKEWVILDHVGNYARGSKFEDLNDQITPELVEHVHQFYQSIDGMHFCRMDVKAMSIEALSRGEFKLLEINGAKSEPLHMYDPRQSFFSVLRITHKHWSTLFRIVKKNIKTANFPSSMEGIRSYYSLKKMVS